MTEVLEKQTELEAVGPAFLKDKMLEMRAKTRNTIHAIAAALQARHGGRGCRGHGQGSSCRGRHGARLA